MANTLNDLYLKYTNKVVSSLEKDRYFQYMFEMLSAGDNRFQHSSQVMHKQIDEKWLSMIEDSLDSINNIIEKPRRFITTKEEVVPVSLAKKITADSVRHLSQNTQFIAASEDGDVHPTRILNVTVDETYDLYENRFIYHLIQRLVTFIDKRTDVLFWSTGDEKRNVMTMESKIEDGYEEIEYKLEMKIKNRQSFAENESDNMALFMRIDRVRRRVMALKSSSFCSIMAGCAKVRSPIQRTNLIMKDPDYRNCYKLWQFIESYDEVGYSIDIRNTNIEYDEDYLTNMYINLITNYVVFKSLLEMDKRDVLSETLKKHKVLKPKFVKVINEEEVKAEDFDLEDVEVRQVIVEEVTKAQLELQKKFDELNAKLQDVAAQRDEMGSQLETLGYQLETQLEDTERKLKEQKAKLVEAHKLKEEKLNVLRQEALDQVNDLMAKLTQAQESAAAVHQENENLARINATLTAEKQADTDRRQKLEEKLAEVQETSQQLQEHNAALSTLAKQSQEEMQQALADKDAAVKQCQEAVDQAKTDRMLREAAELNLRAQITARQDEEAKNLKAEQVNAQLQEIIDAKDDEMTALRRTIEQLTSEKYALSEKLDREKKQRKESDAKVRELSASVKKSDALNTKLNDELEVERKKRLKAEKKAEGTVLSRYIIAKLNGSANEENNS